LVLLRVKRDDVNGIEKDPDYDPKDEGAEVGTYREVQPEALEVFHKGEWVDLMEHVYSPAFKPGSVAQNADWKANPPKRLK
jgi:hypothetical protein